MADTRFNLQAIGVGNAAETVFETNGSFTVPPKTELDISDYVLDFQGAGVIRIREDGISGAIKHQRRIAADGEIIGDMKVPLMLKNTDQKATKTFVLTYQGAFACAAYLAGTYDQVQS